MSSNRVIHRCSLTASCSLGPQKDSSHIVVAFFPLLCGTNGYFPQQNNEFLDRYDWNQSTGSDITAVKKTDAHTKADWISFLYDTKDSQVFLRVNPDGNNNKMMVEY